MLLISHIYFSKKETVGLSKLGGGGESILSQKAGAGFAIRGQSQAAVLSHQVAAIALGECACHPRLEGGSRPISSGIPRACHLPMFYSCGQGSDMDENHPTSSSSNVFIVRPIGLHTKEER